MKEPLQARYYEHFRAAAKSAAPEDFCFYDSREAPFSLYGLMLREDGAFCRLPREVAARTSNRVEALHAHTSGGRLRFVTDSVRLALWVSYPVLERVDRMSLSVSAGFDVYLEKEGKEVYHDTVIPPIDGEEGYLLSVPLTGNEVTVTLYFPLYNEVRDLKVGLLPGASLKAARPYCSSEPLLFYGSSITQGMGASRPGMSYVARVAREWKMDFVNLGFSGACKGEREMALYLAKQKSAAFILDYDHNAPTPEHLEKTHWGIYQAYRESNPDTPVLLVSRPSCFPEAEHVLRRREIIMNTYLQARAKGDRSVYFVDGLGMFRGEDPFDCVVDGLHPNDLGMKRIAEGISAVLASVWKRASF